MFDIVIILAPHGDVMCMVMCMHLHGDVLLSDDSFCLNFMWLDIYRLHFAH